MKYLKQKLMAATSMMLVAVVMLSSSTYAWFAISTAPDVSEITVEMQANEALEIALGQGADSSILDTYNLTASGDETDGTYGSNITITADDMAKVRIGVAAEADDGDLQTVTYDGDGRPDALVDLTKLNATSGYDFFGYSTDSTTLSAANCYAMGIGFFLRTNVAGNVTFSTDSTITISDTTFDESLLVVELIPYTKNASTNIYDVEGTAISVILTETSTSGEYALSTTNALITSAGIDTSFYYELVIYLDGEAVTNANVSTASSPTIEIYMEFENDGM